MSTQPTWKDRVRYAFDNYMARGTGALISGLGMVSLVIIAVMAAVISLLKIAPGDGEPVGFIEAAWLSLMRTLDAGTMGGDEGWGFRIAMFVVTLGGVFVISALIGVLTSGLEGRLEELRKGRSRVIEQNHTIILGWSEQIFTVISELVAANENQAKSCIVIMGERDKVEMEEEIAQKVEATGKTRVVCRSGNPMEMADLSIVSLNTAKSIIVLSPESEAPDSQVIKTCLAILNHSERRSEPYHIVAELRDPKNDEVAKVVGHAEVEWVQVGNLVARVIAQTCRQSGLSVVYTELLDFGGDEIYFTEQPALVGKTYGEALGAFRKNAVMGIVPAGGGATLNPPMGTVLQAGDRLAVIAEDDDKIFLNPDAAAPQKDLIVPGNGDEGQPERTLVMGWNWRGATILAELDNYVIDGSTAVVVADQAGAEEAVARIAPELKHQTVVFQEGDTTDRRTLEALDLGIYDHIILLSYSDDLDMQQADARTLITLLHLRDIADQRKLRFSIVTEMLDVRNRNLAEITRADDFIVSDKLVSLMLAQVSENKGLNAVFADMFDPEGSEIYVRPVERYVKTGQAVDFYTILASARQKGETAIGYRLQKYGRDAAQAYGVHLNPDKAEKVVFEPGDRIVVLAE